jgi:hypothetical protein
LEHIAISSGVTTVANLKEQGFHWEKATNWGGAMTCYYHAALILDEQGDGTGARMLLTSAYQMLCRMKVEADVPLPDLMASCKKGDGAQKLFNVSVTEQVKDLLSHLESFNQQPREERVSQLLKILVSVESDMTFANVHKVFEGDTALLQVGLSVTVKLAQSLITAGMSGVAWNLLEQVVIVFSVLTLASDTAMPSRDGARFVLEDESVCFAAISGMFLLLLLNEAKDDAQCSRRILTQKLAISLTRSRPEYEVHYLMALLNRLKHLDNYIHLDATAAKRMFPVAKEIMSLYSVEKHSKALVFHYGSDRVINALCCILKVLHMQGRFAESKEYAEFILRALGKVKDFYSHFLSVVTFLPVWAMYHSNHTSSLLVDKLVRLEQRQRRKDLHPGLLVLQEWISLIYREKSDRRAERRATYMTQGMTDAASAAAHACASNSSDQCGSPLSKAVAAAVGLEPEINVGGSNSPSSLQGPILGVDENQKAQKTHVHQDSPIVDQMIRSRIYVQETCPSRTASVQRLFMVGAELAIASICLLKAERLEKMLEFGAPKSQIVEYLNLGLDHLKFTSVDSATNETFLFSSLHEKLLRAKLLIKVSEYASDIDTGIESEKCESGKNAVVPLCRSALLKQAYDNIELCVKVASEHCFHAVLYQVGALKKLLGKMGLLIVNGVYKIECKINLQQNLDKGEQDILDGFNHSIEESVLSVEGRKLQDSAFKALVASNGTDTFSLFVC